MLALASIWAVTLRHIRLWKRDINLMLSGLFWPLIDIVVFGFMGFWIQQSQEVTTNNYVMTMIICILHWQIIGRGCMVVSFTFVEELWSHNITNLFSLPLHIVEWIGGVIIFSWTILGITLAYCMTLIYFLYSIPFLTSCTALIIFSPPLLFSGIWIGFTALQFIALLGKRANELCFILGWATAPFSGAFFPIEILPTWAQTISSFLPMSYVFQGIRAYLMYQHDPTPYLIKGYVLSILYAIVAIIVFVCCFTYSKRKGLARLTD